MPALSSVQMAPTGRSVSRSYADVLDSLVPSGTTIGIAPSLPGEQEDVEEPRYEAAMAYLIHVDPKTGLTNIETYSK